MAIEGATPGERLRLYDEAGVDSGSGVVDAVGALILRGLPDGTYTVASETMTSEPFDVLAPTDVPDQSFYGGQEIGPGTGDAQRRPVVRLHRDSRRHHTAAFVSLPGDAAAGRTPR